MLVRFDEADVAGFGTGCLVPLNPLVCANIGIGHDTDEPALSTASADGGGADALVP